MEDVELASTLSRVAENLVRWLRDGPTAEPLSPPAASILLRLQSEGPMRVTDIARTQRITQPAATQFVGRLENEGFVNRRPCEDDRRSVLVHITAAGSAAAEARRRRRAERLHAHLALISPGERDAIERALPALEALIASEPNTQTRERENT